MSTAQRNTLIAVGLLALLVGVAWYLFVYNSASGRCNRGDLGACIVLSVQQAEQSASASAEQSANEAAASAQASASAAIAASIAAEQQAAHQAAILQLEQATCAKVGGKWTSGLGGSYCAIDYRSPDDGQIYHYTVSFDNDGNVTPLTNGPQNAQQCATYYGPGVTGYWHAETDVCAI
jgi:hypothetical protein